MEAVERMRPADQERHFDGKLRFWRDRYRAEGHAGGLAEGHAGGLAEGHAKGLAEGLARERQLLLRQATRKYGAGGAAGIPPHARHVPTSSRPPTMVCEHRPIVHETGCLGVGQVPPSP